MPRGEKRVPRLLCSNNPMPRYYRLVIWTASYPEPTKINHGMEMEAISITKEPLFIFGYEERSKYPEDQRIMDQKYEAGFIFGRWFSSICTDGELGFHHRSELTEIKEYEFKAWKRMVTP